MRPELLRAMRILLCRGLMCSKYPSERAMLRTVERAYDADLEPESRDARSE